MTIIGLQRRIHEAGRIRIGQQVPTQNGKTRPAKLDTFRLTSRDHTRIAAAAQLLGGEPRQWDAPAGRQWEVVTDADAIDVVVPPTEMAFSQHYELWSGGGCQRRCDGLTEQLSDGPCLCDPDERECKPHTRLSVMIRDLPGLGVWRIDTQGYYAAVELEGAVQIVQAAAGSGTLLPARLRLEQRQVKRPGVQTRNFAVPVLDIEVTPAQMLGGALSGPSLGGGQPAQLAAAGASPLAQLPAAQPDPDDGAEQGLLTPVPATVQERPAAPVSEQATVPSGGGGGVKRAGAAAAVPRTGLAPRTAAQAEAGEIPRDREPEGVAPQTGEDLESLTVAQLKIRCRKAGLAVSGTKAELLERLQQAPGEARDEPEADPTPQGQGTPPQDTDDDGSTPDPNGPHSEQQRRKLFAILREHDITEAQRKAVLQAKYGTDSLSDLNHGQVSWLIDRLGQDGGPDAFKAVAEEWLAQQQTDDGDEPGPDTCFACGEIFAGEHDCGTTSDDAHEPEITQEAPLTPAERAYRHANGESGDVFGRLQARIRGSFSILAVHRDDVYRGGWGRLEKITDGRAADSDWSGASEAALAALAEDMERAARDAMADDRGEDADG